MSEEALPKIESIEIDPGGRRILHLIGVTAKDVRELVDAFHASRESDEIVLVLHGASGIELHIE